MSLKHLCAYWKSNSHVKTDSTLPHIQTHTQTPPTPTPFNTHPGPAQTKQISQFESPPTGKLTNIPTPNTPNTTTTPQEPHPTNITDTPWTMTQTHQNSSLNHCLHIHSQPIHAPNPTPLTSQTSQLTHLGPVCTTLISQLPTHKLTKKKNKHKKKKKQKKKNKKKQKKKQANKQAKTK